MLIMDDCHDFPLYGWRRRYCGIGARRLHIMSGDWIPMRLDLDRDQDVIDLAELLEIPETHVVGLLQRFWSWMSEQTTDGNAPRVTKAWMDRYVCNGTSVTGFCDALEQVGWLEQSGRGIRVHDFEKWLSDTAKSRAKTRLRVKKHRNTPLEECNAPTVSKSLLQNRTEQKILEPAAQSPSSKKTRVKVPLPDVLNTLDFKASWERYLTHRREKRSTLTPTASKRLLVKLAKWGEVRAVAALEHSVANGYTGVFEGKDDVGTQNRGGRIPAEPGQYAELDA